MNDTVGVENWLRLPTFFRRQMMLFAISGFAVGCLVTLDPILIGYFGPDVREYLPYPYMFSAALLLLAVVLVPLGATLLHHPPGGRTVSAVVLVLMIIGVQTESLQLGRLDPTEIVTGSVLVGLAVGIPMGVDFRFTKTVIHGAALVLLAFYVASLAIAIQPGQWVRSTKHLVMFFVVFNFLCWHRQVPTYLTGLMIVTVFSAVFAIFQEVAWITSQAIIVGNIEGGQLKTMFEPTSLGPFFRTPGLMLVYRDLAVILALCFCYGMAIQLFGKQMGWLRRIVLWTAMGLYGAAIVCTFSNDAMLGTALGSSLLILVRLKRYVLQLTVAAAFATALVLAYVAISPGKADLGYYVVKEVKNSEMQRIELDRAGIRGFLHAGHFWNGRGLGMAKRYTWHERSWPPHNGFILIGVDLGIFAFLLYVAFWAWVTFRVISMNVLPVDESYLPIVRGLLAGYFVYFVYDNFQGSYAGMNLMLYVALVEATALIVADRRLQWQPSG